MHLEEGKMCKGPKQESNKKIALHKTTESLEIRYEILRTVEDTKIHQMI